MKKIVLFLALLISLSSFAGNDNYSRWSVSGEIGFNKFDGDISQKLVDVFPSSILSLTGGINVEYTMTPYWGLSADYFYIPINANTNGNIKVNTNIHTTDFNVMVNITRLIFPENRSKFSVNGYIGTGVSYYKYNTKPVSTTLSDNYGMAITLPVALSLEYNYSKHFDIGVKAHYRAFNKDNLEGMTAFKGVTNDRVGLATVYLRYKFTKNKPHIRNVIPKDIETNLNDINNRLNTQDKKIETQGKKVDSIARIISNDGPDSDGDGVPDIRDREPNTPHETPVDFWGVTLKIKCCNTTIVNNNYDSIPELYFNFNETKLEYKALQTIKKIAAIMKYDHSLIVEVRGFCDYVGTDAYNYKLSVKRADKVKRELVKTWNIPSENIIANGKGRILSPKLRDRFNRKCQFLFNK